MTEDKRASGHAMGRRGKRKPASLARRAWRRSGLTRLQRGPRRRFRKFIRKPRVASIIGRVRRQRVVHFLHIPKTGGTAVKAALQHCRTPPDVRFVQHGHFVRLRDIPARDEVIFFTRDPVSRYVSGFNDRLREGRPGYVAPWDAFERTVFERFPSPESLAVALSSDDASVREEARRAMEGTRNIQSRMTDWLGDPAAFRARSHQVMFVGRTESLSADFDRLKAVLGIKGRCQLPTDTDKKSHRAPGTQPTALSDVAIANVRRWYAEDEQLIEACREITSRVGGTPEA